MELEHDPNQPILAVIIKTLSFVCGVIAVIPSVDLTVRVLSLMGMLFGLWLTVIIHEDKVKAKIQKYKDTFKRFF